MKTERVLLAILAVVIGLLVAGAAFFLYENTKKNPPPNNIKTASIPTPTPTPKPSIFLTVDQPKDEEVVSKKIITISGKTTKDATIAVLTNNDEQVLTPTGTGNFSTTTTIEDGQNLIEITAIGENGESASILRVITFSTEEF